jgi:magnesium-protoporphyrin IX monomethyl ester (oxidative) cyclase
MKILLIVPPTTTYGADPTVPVAYPPLGLAYIAGFLEKAGHEVKILDAITSGIDIIAKEKNRTRYGLSDNKIFEEIESYQPDVVGITCMFTAYANDAHNTAKIVKKCCDKIPVIFGGAHASINPELVLKDKNVDMVVVGEGEITFLEIIEKLERKKDLNSVQGMVLRNNGEIVKNQARPYITDLDILPFPARHLLSMEKYIAATDNKFAMRKPNTVMITSRGCPGHCIFCSIHSVWGHKWRARSAKNVVDEIEFLIEEYGMEEFYFMDDSMGASKKRLEQICDEIINRKLDIKWTAPNGIAHWTLDEKILYKMKKCGCYRLTFGIESGNIETRKFIRKTYDLGQAKKVIKYANRIGMWTNCTFIIGFPYEKENSIEDTINFAIESDTDFATFYLLCPHPGTELYEIYKNENLLNFDHVLANENVSNEDYACLGEILAAKGAKTKYISKEELRTLLTGAYRKFVFNRLISLTNPTRILRKIRSLEDLKYTSKLVIIGISIIYNLLLYGSFTSHLLRKK